MGTAEGLRHLRDTDLLHRRLVQSGWRDGSDLQYLRVPGGQHNEDAWAARFDQVLASSSRQKPDSLCRNIALTSSTSRTLRLSFCLRFSLRTSASPATSRFPSLMQIAFALTFASPEPHEPPQFPPNLRLRRSLARRLQADANPYARNRAHAPGTIIGPTRRFMRT